MEEKRVVVDTSGLFASADRLRALLNQGASLSTPDLVLFEFVKSVRKEAAMARGVGNTRRAEIMAALERRLPGVLRDLGIEVWGSPFGMSDLDEVLRLVAKGHEPGDAMIWVKMQKTGLDTIATGDVSDWKSLGAHVVSLA